jgi:hypothetical protein
VAARRQCAVVRICIGWLVLLAFALLWNRAERLTWTGHMMSPPVAGRYNPGSRRVERLTEGLMSPIRFRIRTIMIIIAVSAMMMGVYRFSPPILYALSLCVALYFLLLVSPVVLFPFIAVYDWFVRARRRQFPRDQSPIPETRTDSKRGAGESVG